VLSALCGPEVTNIPSSPRFGEKRIKMEEKKEIYKILMLRIAVFLIKVFKGDKSEFVSKFLCPST
jgi:hypothetical protein